MSGRFITGVTYVASVALPVRNGRIPAGKSIQEFDPTKRAPQRFAMRGSGAIAR